MSKKPLILFPQTLSVTQDIDLFMQCEYKWSLLRLFWYRRLEQEFHKDKDFGKYNAAAHQLIREAYYRDGKSAQQALQIGISFIEDKFAPYYMLSGADEPVKNPTKLIELLKRYYEEIPLDRDTIVPFMYSENEVSMEQQFFIELPFLHPELGVPIKLSAKPDLLGVEVASKVAVIVDEKTAGQTGASDERARANTEWGYKLNNQFVQYAVVINKEIQKYGVKPIHHAEIRREVLTQKVLGKKGESIPTNSKVVETYHFSLSDWYQETWYNNLVDHVLPDMLEAYYKYKETGNKSKSFMRRYGNCVSFNRPCEFKETCAGELWEHVPSTFNQTPCMFKEHCTEVGFQNIEERYGMQQIVYDKDKDISMSLEEKRKKLGLD